MNGLILASACVLCACQTSAEPVARASIPHVVEERIQPVQVAASKPQPSAAAPRASTAREQVSVGGTLLTLDGCQLTVESAGTVQKHTLPMPEGCTFGKRKAGGPVQIETTSRGSAVLVVSSKSLGGRDCDTHVRALVVSKRGVELSSDEQEINMCGADGPFDTPAFITLAASAKPLN